MFIVVALQQMVISLECYVCDYCSTPSNLETVTNDTGYSCTVSSDSYFLLLNNSHFFLLSQKSTTLILGAVTYVSRSYTSGTCTEYDTVIAGTGYKYNCCTTDGCNTAVALLSSIILTFALVAVVLVFKMNMVN